MANRDDGGPAFPSMESHFIGHLPGSDVPATAETRAQGGMTLRDYFAAAALSGMLASPKLTNPIGGGFDKVMAEEAYKSADAMLKERAR